MKEQVAKSRKLLIIGIGIVFIAMIVTAANMYRVEQHSQSEQEKALTYEGIAQFREGQYEQSLQTFRRIPQDSINDWHIPYYMGSAMIRLNDFKSAVLQLEKAHTLNPDEKNIPFALGVAYYKLGKLSLAKAYFGEVLKIDPGNEEAKGLMDIMASLERKQPGAAQEDNQENAGIDG